MTEQDKHETWEACPAGEIQRMVNRSRSRRVTERLSRVASVAAIAVVLVIGTFVGGRYWLEQQTQPVAPGSYEHVVAGISCGEVIEHLPAYVNDTLHREDPGLYELVFMHLQKCAACDAKKKELRDSQTAQQADALSVVQIKNKSGIVAHRSH